MRYPGSFYRRSQPADGIILPRQANFPKPAMSLPFQVPINTDLIKREEGNVWVEIEKNLYRTAEKAASRLLVNSKTLHVSLHLKDLPLNRNNP